MKKVILIGNPGSDVVIDFLATHPEVVLMSTVDEPVEPEPRPNPPLISKSVMLTPKYFPPPKSKFHK